jgi:hypothetical protein
LSSFRKQKAVTRLLAGGSLVALLAIGAPAGADGGHWEAFLGHFGSQGEAKAVASKANSHHIATLIQKISGSNWEVEVANGLSSKAAAESKCGPARHAGLHCSAEVEFHGNQWHK